MDCYILTPPDIQQLAGRITDLPKTNYRKVIMEEFRGFNKYLLIEDWLEQKLKD